MIESFKIWQHQGKQYIPDVIAAKPGGFKMGRPIIDGGIAAEIAKQCANICPTEAFNASPVYIDLGKCVFCGECVRIAGHDKINFTNDSHTASNVRENLIVHAGVDKRIELDETQIRKEIHSLFGRSLKLRQVSAGGDASCEWELGATSNPNFDMGRFGIDFVASPRHSDGIVITGPITENMSEALQICYDAIATPKIIILAGTDAISGGIFAGSPALDRTFLDNNKVDLYVPGNPIHPLTFINGVLELIKHKLSIKK